MAKFIELTGGLTKKMINVDNISYIDAWDDGSATIQLVGEKKFFLPKENYETIKNMIKNLEK